MFNYKRNKADYSCFVIKFELNENFDETENFFNRLSVIKRYLNEEQWIKKYF